MLKLVIIDDMKNAREVIESLVKKHCPNIEVAGTADGVQSGIQLIKQCKPDIVLLDIQMRDGTGFDLINKCKPVDFHVIFISAYEEHALKAFKFSALDYILKPIDSAELIDAIKKAENVVASNSRGQNIDILESNYTNESKETKKIILKTLDSIYALSIKDIVRCEAEVNYTHFFLSDGRKILISKPLKEYDELLSEYGFFRTHQSHLINLDYFERFKKTDGGFAILKDGSVIPVSSRKKDSFLQAIDTL
ncbi:MAG TPA: LytTR family DNA-binding domain-containing protein [Bacteroidia bacterium]|jgi:two-component system LytT family response regulator|nr:LytTR family DNA-binding domain-containing protein [Bacteroidia bacterium]